MDAESPRLDSESLPESLWMKDHKKGVDMDEHMKGRCQTFWNVSRGESRVGPRQATAALRSVAARGQPSLQGGEAGSAL